MIFNLSFPLQETLFKEPFQLVGVEEDMGIDNSLYWCLIVLTPIILRQVQDLNPPTLLSYVMTVHFPKFCYTDTC